MRSIASWIAPLPIGGQSDEHALVFDQSRDHRILVLPALFDEANKLRRTAVEIMHRLDLAGIDSFLPDMPGCNDSLAPLREQTLAGWQAAAHAAAKRFEATHCFTIRGGALLAPDHLPGWRYAPSKGSSQLRSMIRARIIASQEKGQAEDRAVLDTIAHEDGIVLAGWDMGATLYSELSEAVPPPSELQADIPQDVVGGAGQWLRAEPDENPEQADAIAAIIAVTLEGSN